MKKIIIFLLILLFSIITIMGSCNKKEDMEIDMEKPIKILAIGNSFTEDAFTYLWDIMNSLGFKSVQVAYVFIPGGSLDHHFNCIENNTRCIFANNNSGFWIKGQKTHEDAITQQEWDFITLQQVSGESCFLHTYSALENLVGYVKRNSPESKILWHQTWAYQQDFNHSVYVNYGWDQKMMYENICEAVQKNVLTNDAICGVIPSGTAVQNARTSSLGDTLTRDGFHLSEIGKFIAGLAYAGTITGMDISGVEFRPDGIDETTAQICIQSVSAALTSKFSITEINL